MRSPSGVDRPWSALAGDPPCRSVKKSRESLVFAPTTVIVVATPIDSYAAQSGPATLAESVHALFARLGRRRPDPHSLRGRDYHERPRPEPGPRRGPARPGHLPPDRAARPRPDVVHRFERHH